MADERLDDEKLDEMLDAPQPEPETPPDQPSDETDTPAPVEPGNEDDEDEGADVGVDEESDDPKDIVIRNLRNKNRRLTDKLRKKPETTTPPETTPAANPRPRPGSPLYNRFMENEFRTNVLFAERTDPTIIARLPEIKKILFVEHPEWLENADGFQTANELAKGRTINVATPQPKGAELHPQTSPARPRASSPAKKELTYEEYVKLPEAERVAYENSRLEQAAGKK